MTEYEVYYRRKETFRLDKKLKPADVKTQKTHVRVALKEGSMDDVFRVMQGEFMDARTRANVINFIRAGETNHQSMSVGDAVRNADTGTIYQCDMVGWEKVGGK
jgi:hypothetical protein